MGILDSLFPKKNIPQQRATPRQSVSPFEKKYWITKDEFKRWAQRSHVLFRDVCKGSPSKREELLKKFEEYWPDSFGSLNKNTYHSLKQKLQHERLFGETLEKQKAAEDLLKLLDTFEKDF